MERSSVRVTKAGCNLHKPFRKGNSKTLHASIVYTSTALKDTYSVNKLTPMTHVWTTERKTNKTKQKTTPINPTTCRCNSNCYAISENHLLEAENKS